MGWKFWQKKEPKKVVHHHDWITLRSSNHAGIHYNAANLTEDFPEFLEVFEGNRSICKRNDRVYLQVQRSGLFDMVCATCGDVKNSLTEEVAKMLDYHLAYTTKDKMEKVVNKANKEAKKILLKTLDKYDIESYRTFGTAVDED